MTCNDSPRAYAAGCEGDHRVLRPTCSVLTLVHTMCRTACLHPGVRPRTPTSSSSWATAAGWRSSTCPPNGRSRSSVARLGQHLALEVDSLEILEEKRAALVAHGDRRAGPVDHGSSSPSTSSTRTGTGSSSRSHPRAGRSGPVTPRWRGPQWTTGPPERRTSSPRADSNSCLRGGATHGGRADQPVCCRRPPRPQIMACSAKRSNERQTSSMARSPSELADEVVPCRRWRPLVHCVAPFAGEPATTACTAIARSNPRPASDRWRGASRSGGTAGSGVREPPPTRRAPDPPPPGPSRATSTFARPDPRRVAAATPAWAAPVARTEPASRRVDRPIVDTPRRPRVNVPGRHSGGTLLEKRRHLDRARPGTARSTSKLNQPSVCKRLQDQTRAPRRCGRPRSASSRPHSRCSGR